MGIIYPDSLLTAEALFFLGVAVKDFPTRGCKDFL